MGFRRGAEAIRESCSKTCQAGERAERIKARVEYANLPRDESGEVERSALVAHRRRQRLTPAEAFFDRD